MEIKKVCSEKDCFKIVDLEDESKKQDGTYHRIALKCFDCRTPQECNTLKNYNKRQRRKRNKI